MWGKRENEELEFKKTLSELSEGVISLSSMLNKCGHGIVCFGVRNDGDIYGIDVGERTITKVVNEIRNHIRPVLAPKVEQQIVEGKDIIVVEASGQDTPYSAYGRFYIRVDDQDCTMTNNQLSLFFQNKDISYSAWEKAPTVYGAEVVDEDQLIEYIRQSNETGRMDYRYRDVQDALTRMGLMEKGRLNNAGFYLFSDRKPLSLKLAVFASDEKLSFLDNRIFEGNIFECIREGLLYISSNIHFNARVVGTKREEKPEIPLEAIREIVVNSFAHMHVIPGVYNEITICPSSVRIYNPGTIAMNLDPKSFADGTVGSKIRNPLIASALYRNRLIEGFGTGFRRVMSLCEKEKTGYNYHNDPLGFVFEFKRSNTSLLGTAVSENTPVYASVDCESVLALAESNHGRIQSITQVAELIGKSYVTAQRLLNSMCMQGFLVHRGAKKNGFWELASDRHF